VKYSFWLALRRYLLPPALPQSLVFPEIETVPAAISVSGVRGSTEGEGPEDGRPNRGGGRSRGCYISLSLEEPSLIYVVLDGSSTL
jgi:hypothetical protein